MKLVRTFQSADIDDITQSAQISGIYGSSAPLRLNRRLTGLLAGIVICLTATSAFPPILLFFGNGRSCHGLHRSRYPSCNGAHCRSRNRVRAHRNYKRRGIAFQNISRSLLRKASSHPARLNFPRKEPFDPSFCMALRTMCLSTARLCGPLPNRVLS